MREPDVASHTVAFTQAFNLRRLRKQRGLSQAELARRAGVPRVTTTRAEGGDVCTTMEHLSALAVALCVPVDDLLKAPPKNAKIVKRTANRKVRQ